MVAFNCISCFYYLTEIYNGNFGVQCHAYDSRWHNLTVEFDNVAAEVKYDSQNNFIFKIIYD